ncbi:MAG TPA: hypothetical protein VK897_20110 [Anaerolineales bacterium]|nr:hypothetical protein [Anaerolineales bacterium]
MEISGRRTYHEFVKTVETISPRRAIDIARDVVVGEWNGVATVRAIEPSYYFNEDTGFLIPTWQIHAVFVSQRGQEFEWAPNIAAIK